METRMTNHFCKEEWCGNCTHCVHDPSYSLRGYYCMRDYEGYIGDAWSASDGIVFLANQEYESGMEACADWESVEEAKREAELDGFLADILISTQE